MKMILKTTLLETISGSFSWSRVDFWSVNGEFDVCSLINDFWSRERVSDLSLNFGFEFDEKTSR